MRVFFDTETTGFYNFKEKPNHPSQPHIVQLAYMVDSNDGETYGYGNIYVACPIDIPKGAEDVHGLNKRFLDKYGVDRSLAIGIITNLLENADSIIAHNSDYDLACLLTAHARIGYTTSTNYNHKTVCTMKRSTDLCKLPGRYGNYKWPKLTEAYELLVDPAGFEDAHDAMADTKACRALFYKIIGAGK